MISPCIVENVKLKLNVIKYTKCREDKLINIIRLITYIYYTKELMNYEIFLKAVIKKIREVDPIIESAKIEEKYKRLFAYLSKKLNDKNKIYH